MNTPVFYDLEKRLRRKLKHTAHFYPVDLHCHSQLSPCFGRKDGIYQDDIDSTAEQIAIAACEKGIYILAITDHHRCENAKTIADSSSGIKFSGNNLYLNNNLIVLPGMEITVEENTRNVHILAIFPEGYSSTEIERVIDDTGIEPNPENRTDQSKVTTKRLIEILQRVRDRGGLAILAHVNSTSGYREEMRAIGQDDFEIIEKICKLPIHAIEVSMPQDVPHFTFNNKPIPCVIGSDAHYLKDIGGKEYITRVKMTTPGFSDLVRALEDPETRIRFQDPKGTGIRNILGIKFNGGFLDQQIIPFTSNLNCLIGGRGTGKSSCIEAIRYLFGKNIPSDRKKDVDRLKDSVFSGCTAQLIYEDQHGDKYVLQRTYGDSATKIMNLDGFENTDVNLQMSHNLKLSFYGWSEVEGIAKDSTQQLSLIDSFIEEIEPIKNEEQKAIGELKANAREIKSEMEAVKLETNEVGNIQELENELNKIGEEQKEEELNKERIDNETEMLNYVIGKINKLYNKTKDVDIEEEIKEIYEHINNTIANAKILFIDEILDISQTLIDSIEENSPLTIAKENLLSELSKIQKIIDEKKLALKEKHLLIDTAFARLLENLEQAEAKQIAQRRAQLRNEIRNRKKAQQRKEEAERTLKERRDIRIELLDKLKAVRSKLFTIRQQYIKQISAKLPKGKADVEVTLDVLEQGERKKFIQMLDDKLVGLPKHWREGKYPFMIAEHYTPIEFTKAIKSADIDSLNNAGFDQDTAIAIWTHLIDKHEDLMEIESCECTDLPRIYFDVQGYKKPIEDLSPGQRCTALLPIILLETDSPLIIDQPEDNLDNQFIFELVVNTMRSLKECRQIIVATHNPNIPVSGDAENILVFKPDGSRGKLERNGSIDYDPIIEEVKTIMEGGEEAFVVRVKKYNL